jgi:hypothetical protein
MKKGSSNVRYERTVLITCSFKIHYFTSQVILLKGHRFTTCLEQDLAILPEQLPPSSLSHFFIVLARSERRVLLNLEKYDGKFRLRNKLVVMYKISGAPLKEAFSISLLFRGNELEGSPIDVRDSIRSRGKQTRLYRYPNSTVFETT